MHITAKANTILNLIFDHGNMQIVCGFRSMHTYFKIKKCILKRTGQYKTNKSCTIKDINQLFGPNIID